MTDVAEIAAGLSKAQREALLRLCELGRNPYGWRASDFCNSGATAYALYTQGIVYRGRVYGGSPTYVVEDRGLAVAAHLKDKEA